MGQQATTHYLNADFDLALRERRPPAEPPHRARQVRELSLQALIGADSGDAALLRAGVPESYVRYLASCGLPVPRVLDHPQTDPATVFRPFGWSAEAIELNRKHAAPSAHPSLSCIRRVNARSFGLSVERELHADPDRPARIVESPQALESVLASGNGAWVVKAEHGNSGLANRRLAAAALSSADRRWVEGRLREDDRLVVEPWRRRVSDWSVVFDVPFDPSTVRVHETVCTAAGALVGARFAPETNDAETFSALAESARGVALRLTAEGYFGPVCQDAFVWDDGGARRLRPLVDLNCRRSMSDGAYRLWRRIAPDRHLFYRFFNRRRLRLPEDQQARIEALGARGFTTARGEGILFASPVSFSTGRGSTPTAKPAVVFIAPRVGEVHALERWFRDRFEV